MQAAQQGIGTGLHIVQPVQGSAEGQQRACRFSSHSELGCKVHKANWRVSD